MNYLPPDINFLNLEVTSVFFVAVGTALVFGLVCAFFAIWFEFFFTH